MILQLIRDNNVEQLREKLKSENLDLYSKDEDGYTPLHLACVIGSVEVVRLFLKHPLNIDDENKFGNTSLHTASEEGYVDIVRLLLKHSVDINVKGVDGFTALHYAVSMTHNDVTNLLLEHQADVNARADSGRTPLWIGVSHFNGRDKKVIETLLKFGANPSIPDNSGTTLHVLLDRPIAKPIENLFQS